MFKIVNGGKLPTKGSKHSAGETKLVPLGIAIDELKIKEMIYSELSQFRDYKSEQNENLKIFNKFLESHYLSLKPRSSLILKGLVSHSAVIDLDYKDEIKMVNRYVVGHFVFEDYTKKDGSTMKILKAKSWSPSKLTNTLEEMPQQQMPQHPPVYEYQDVQGQTVP